MSSTMEQWVDELRAEVARLTRERDEALVGPSALIARAKEAEIRAEAAESALAAARAEIDRLNRGLDDGPEIDRLATALAAARAALRDIIDGWGEDERTPGWSLDDAIARARAALSSPAPAPVPRDDRDLRDAARAVVDGDYPPSLGAVLALGRALSGERAPDTVACVKCLAEHADDCPDRIDFTVKNGLPTVTVVSDPGPVCKCGHLKAYHDGVRGDGQCWRLIGQSHDQAFCGCRSFRPQGEGEP